jgi:hypothetical protein
MKIWDEGKIAFEPPLEELYRKQIDIGIKLRTGV